MKIELVIRILTIVTGLAGLGLLAARTLCGGKPFADNLLLMLVFVICIGTALIPRKKSNNQNR